MTANGIPDVLENCFQENFNETNRVRGEIGGEILFEVI